MSGRGQRGRARVSASGAAPGSGPTGRGRGLGARPPAPAPEPSGAPAAESSPAVAPRIGRGVILPTGPPPPGTAWGRGRGLAQMRPQPAPEPSATAPSTAAAASAAPSSPAPTPGPSASTAIATAGPSMPPPAPAIALDIDLSAMSLALVPDIPLFKRKAVGEKGRAIPLQSNLFSITLSGKTWYKYDVEISTQKEQQVELATAEGVRNKDKIQSRRLNRMIIEALFRKHRETLGDHWPAYDGRKTLICAEKFFDEHIFTVDLALDNGRSRQYVVKLKLTLEIDVNQVSKRYEASPLNPEFLQAANIVIDSSLGIQYTAVNRAYYATNATLRNYLLGGGKELRSGIYTSTIFAQWKPLLVVDKSNTAFYMKGNLVDYIQDFFKDLPRRDSLDLHTGLKREQVNQLSRDLRGVIVKLRHAPNGRCVKINSLTENSANQIEFRLSDERLTTVAQYFNERYRDHSLKYPNLPCVTVVRANGTKTDYYPLEVCDIKENQPYRRKLNPQQTSKMIRQCQEGPTDRIQNAIRNVQTILRASTSVLKQHGVDISVSPVETVGRMIDSPMILVKETSIKPIEGKWLQTEFHEGAKMRQWCIVDCGSVDVLANKLADSIEKLAKRMGIQEVGKPSIIDGSRNSVKQILSEVKRYHKFCREPMMAVIILGGEPQMYSQIKLHTETTNEFDGIVTQCVKAENLRNGKGLKDNFVNNLLKKMNVKLGGINNAIVRNHMPRKLVQEDFIVIGADVSHPGVGDFMTPSIAAVVGSLDYIPSKYWTEIRVQTNETNNRIEYIKDLKEVAMILLKEHRRRTRNRPRRIYYIRDGVSDGQFDEVRRREIGALREACLALENGYQPEMTVLIAQKRHHVRFNVMNKKRDGTGREGNVPPGTYIDQKVVHPVNFDLYMYTHNGLLGTSRPTHYHLIHSDDNDISTDDITELIYHLCHVYARTTSTVSIPAPIYYAHLAAYRAKEHVKGNLNLVGSDTRSLSSGGDGVIANLSEYQRTCTVDTKYRSWLYFA